MKKYFFGYLFVKIAKLLAVCALLVGIGYCFWKYGQAHLSAESASYRSSDYLQSQLVRLASSARSAHNIVESFVGKDAVPLMPEPNFSRNISSNGDFEALAGKLAGIDESRGQLKQAVISGFDTLVATIEEKLRARAAALAAATAVPSAQAAAPAATPMSETTPPRSAADRETLYIENLDSNEIQRRSTSLENTKQLLVALQTASEDPKNRQILEEAESRLEKLATLLPPIAEPAETTNFAPQKTTQPSQTAPTPPPKTFNAEKVANQLRASRSQVRAAIVSSWEFDEAFSRASEAASLESGKCRISSLIVKGIWLSFFGQIGLAILATLLVAFLILVFADLTQTLLDTATNTGITADAQSRIKLASDA